MAGFQFNPDDYVGLPAAAPPPTSNGRGLIPAAVGTGFNEAASQLGSAIRGFGDLTGLQGVSRFGQVAEQTSSAAAAQSARPDLEGSPFQGGVSHVVPWAIYNVLKGAPQFAAIAAGAAAAPEVAAGRVVAGALAASPFSFGQAYQATEQQPGGEGNAKSALMMTPALSVLQSWLPGHAEGLIARAAETGGVSGLVKSGLVTGAMQAPISGAMTAITDAANPTLTTKQRMDNIVDAAVSGGVMGGVIGAGAAGIGGLRAMRRVDPAKIQTEDLGSVVDSFLQLPKPEGQPGGPQMGSGPSMFADAAGRVANDTSTLTATPRDTGMSPTDRMVADATIPQAPPAIDSSTIIQDKQGSLRHAKAYEQDDTSRPFRNLQDPELMSYIDILSNKEDLKPEHQSILEGLQQELDHRTSANPALTPDMGQDAVGAVTRTGDDKSGVADQVSAAPAPTNKPTIEDTLKGISTRKSYADAKDVDEVKARLLERLQNGSTAKGDLALADRLGVDTNAPGKAVETEAQGVPKQDDKAALAAKDKGTTEPAAPANAEGGDRSVDAEFQQQWSQDLSKKQGLALKDLRDNPPANEEDARQRIYDALGKNTPGEDEVTNKGKNTDGYNAVVDLAKKFGILNKDGSYTDAGLDIAKSRLSMEDTTAEAQKRGLNGTEMSLFDSGARGIAQDKFGSIEEFKAYQDGRQWGEDQRNGADLHPGATDAQTKEVQGSLRDTRPTEDITRMQFLNQAIDKVYGESMRPQEQARLKQMVRNGATGPEVDAAARQLRDAATHPNDERRYYQTGHGALAAAAPTNPELFKGEVVTRGAPRNPEELARIRNQGLRNAGTVAAEGDVTAASQRAIQAHEERKQLLRDEVHGAALSGDIKPIDRLRLLNMVNQNKLQDVIDRLPGGKRHGADQVSTSGFLNRLGEAAVPGHEPEPIDRSIASTALRRKLVVGDARGALAEIGKNSSSPLNRLIANKLNGEWVKDVDLRHEDFDESRKPINDTNIESAVPIARTMFDEGGKSTVSLYGEHGLNEESFLHEMIHALIHRRWAGNPGDDPLAARVNELHDQIVNAIEKAYPELTNNEIWADQVTSSPDEMITWAMTNHEAQEALKRIDIDGNKIDAGKSSLWDQFKGFVADLLGLPTNGRVMSALDHILQAGHAILSEKEAVDAAANVPVPQINDRLTAAVKLTADEGANKVKEALSSADEKLFPHLLQTRSAPDLAEQYGRREKLMPELMPWQRIGQQEDAIPGIFTSIQRAAFDAYTKLEHADPKAAERINNVMAATIRGVNGELGWKDHTWLHKDPQAGVLKSYVDSIHRDAAALRASGQLGVYHGLRDALRATNLTHMSELLHSTVAMNPSLAALSEKLGDPLSTFLDMKDKHNPADAVKHWTDTLNNAMTTIEKEFSTAISDPTLTAEERDHLTKQAAPVSTVIKEIRDNLGAVQKVPYFHAYREGDHMVAATLKTLADGRADPAAAKAVAKALAKAGFDDVTIAPELSNPNIYLAIDNKSQRSVLENALKGLAKQGHIDEGSILSGTRARQSTMSPASRVALEHVISQVKANPLFDLAGKTPAEVKLIEDQQAAVESALREAWLNSLSANSGSRVMAFRKTVQGFSKDMVKSTNFRFGVGAQAVGRLWARPRLNAVIAQMESRARNAMNVNDPQHAQSDKIRSLVNNVRQRDVANAMTARHDWTDSVRTWSNIFHIGASPAMVLVDGSQLGVMVVPHLGARHGYSATLSAMARATPLALKVVREALSQGWKAGGAPRAADIAITHDVLQKAIPDVATRNFLEHMLGKGAIDQSSATYAMTNDSGIGSNPKTGRLLRMAAALPQTTEMMSRMITALAARELHGGKMSITREEYAVRTINDTLGHYGSSSVPPIMSKKGPVGRLGPMLLQFKLFDMNLMWKLYREFHTAFMSKAVNETERAEARSFLIGHAVTVTALAGTLGLPYAAAAAGAVEKLKDEFFPSEHPFNAVGAYRNFLANIFGKDVGDVIAKGLPQTVGFDLSNRVGEGDILPLTQFLTDRQNWSDTLQQWQADAIGAPASMVADQLKGLDQLHNGNVMGGLSTMMPSAIRNPMRAYQMTEHGYIDANGIPLPIDSPGASDILYQLLGLTPSAKADYNDQREIQISTRQALTRESNSLKMQLMRTLMTGDQDGARVALTRAQQFDAANPTYAVLPRLEQQLRMRQQSEAEAKAMGAPLGVNPKDLYARSLNNYAGQ
jgi:hypothetical protein